MTKETLKKAMALHKEIQESQKLLESLAHAQTIMIVCNDARRGVAIHDVSVSVQANLIVSLSRRIDDLKQLLEDL